jgi:hypothetical protein
LSRFQDAFAVAILKRVVGGRHGQALEARIERQTPGDRPGWHSSADLQGEIVVPGRRLVLVDDKDQTLIFS